MKRTFKDRVVFGAARVSKKCILLKPAAYLVMVIVLGAYRLFKYFGANGKKYIVAVVAAIFFFMSSSFTTLDKSEENNVYLDTATSEEADTESTQAKPSPVSLSVSVNTEADSELPDSSDLGSLFENVTVNGDEEGDESEQFSIDEVSVKADEDMVGDTSVFEKNAWYLILVNKTHPIPEGYKINLATIKGNLQCDERVLSPLLTMLDAAKKDGVNIYVTSPYRSNKLQQTLFNKRIKILTEEHGYSYVDAYKAVSQKVIVPGTSEHELGMCFDIITDYHKTLDFEFGDTVAGKWLKNHCAEYGFILRYPKGKEAITGIEFEPWHFRFVGVEAAKYIMEHGITLEEFLEDL